MRKVHWSGFVEDGESFFKRVSLNLSSVSS